MDNVFVSIIILPRLSYFQNFKLLYIIYGHSMLFYLELILVILCYFTLGYFFDILNYFWLFKVVFGYYRFSYSKLLFVIQSYFWFFTLS
jgi:hypothetical protein